MKTIDDVRVSTKDIVAFLGVSGAKLKERIRRDGLMPHRKVGTGRSLQFNFAECLQLYVCEKLAATGVRTEAAALVGTHADALGAFMDGRKLVVGFKKDGKASLSFDPENDMTIHIPLEEFGLELADWFCHHVAAYKDPETGIFRGHAGYEDAKRHFEAMLTQHRGGKV